MNASQQKVVQYLNEAHATEQALVRVLQSQIAMTPRGPTAPRWRRTSRDARPRGARRPSACSALGRGLEPADGGRRRGRDASSGRRSRSARRRSISCAAPAARRRCSRTPRTPAPPRRWRSRPTRRSSAWPAPSATTRRPSWPRRSCADEEKMLERVLREIPKLTDAVVGADVKGKPSYDVTTTGAADAVREPARRPRRPRARPARHQAHRAPGPQGPGRRAGRGPDQGRRGLRGGPGDRALRRAHRRRDHRPADRALPDRPGQDRLLRAQEPEPHHGARAASPRCAATSRGRATTS